MQAIKNAKGEILGADPLGGASLAYWAPIVEKYGIDLTVVNKAVDPTFSFMTVDHDGQIRMDCSSPYATVKLIAAEGSISASRSAMTRILTGMGS